METAHNAGNGSKPAKPVMKNGVSANFGMNMPLMSSAFDTAMWLTAA